MTIQYFYIHLELIQRDKLRTHWNDPVVDRVTELCVQLSIVCLL